MSETPRITDLKARLAALPKIDPVKFKAACRELGPIDPFVYLAKATEKHYPETVYYIYVSADGLFKFKAYEMKRDEPTLKCAKNWLEHTYDHRFYRTTDEAAAMCEFLNENCPDPKILRSRIESAVSKAMSWETSGRRADIEQAVVILSTIVHITGADPRLVMAADCAVTALKSYKLFIDQLQLAKEAEHGSTTETDDRLKEALREFEIDYFGKHGTFDSCGQPTGLEDGYTDEYYKARYWFLKDRGLELPDVETHR